MYSNKPTFNSGRYYHQPSRFGSNPNHYLPRNFFAKDFHHYGDESPNESPINPSHSQNQSRDEKAESFEEEKATDQKYLFDEDLEQNYVSFQDQQRQKGSEFRNQKQAYHHDIKSRQWSANYIDDEPQTSRYHQHRQYNQQFSQEDRSDFQSDQLRQTPFHTHQNSKELFNSQDQSDHLNRGSQPYHSRNPSRNIQQAVQINPEIQANHLKKQEIEQKCQLIQKNLALLKQEQEIYEKVEQILKTVLKIQDEEHYKKYCLLQVSLQILDNYDKLPSSRCKTNLSIYQLDIEDLVKAFSEFGKVKKAYVLPYPNNRIGFVQMDSIVNCFKSIQALNNQHVVQDRCITQVKFVISNDILSQTEKLFHTIKASRIQKGNVFEKELDKLKQQENQISSKNPYDALPKFSQVFESSRYYKESTYTMKQLQSIPSLYNEYDIFKQNYEPLIQCNQAPGFPYQCWFFVQLEDKHILQMEKSKTGGQKSKNLFESQRLEKNEDIFSKMFIGRLGYNISEIFEDVQVQNDRNLLRVSLQNKWDRFNQSDSNDAPLFGFIQAKTEQIFEDAIEATFKLLKKTYINYNRTCCLRKTEPVVKKIFMKAFIMPQTLKQIKSDMKLTLRKISSIIDSSSVQPLSQIQKNHQHVNSRNNHNGIGKVSNVQPIQMFQFQSYPPYYYQFNAEQSVKQSQSNDSFYDGYLDDDMYLYDNQSMNSYRGSRVYQQKSFINPHYSGSIHEGMNQSQTSLNIANPSFYPKKTQALVAKEFPQIPGQEFPTHQTTELPITVASQVIDYSVLNSMLNNQPIFETQSSPPQHNVQSPNQTTFISPQQNQIIYSQIYHKTQERQEYDQVSLNGSNGQSSRNLYTSFNQLQHQQFINQNVAKKTQ
eukprot:403368297